MAFLRKKCSAILTESFRGNLMQEIGQPILKNVKKPWSISSTKEMENDDEVCAKLLKTIGSTPLRAPLNKFKDGSYKISKGNICMP